MKRILLTSTALVAFASAAAAEITWSGTATVGVARTGTVAAVDGEMTDAQMRTYLNGLGAGAADAIIGTGYEALNDQDAELAFINDAYGDLTQAQVDTAIATLADAEWTAAEEAAYIAAKADADAALAAIAGWEDSTEATPADATGVNTLIAATGFAVTDTDNAANGVQAGAAEDTLGEIYALAKASVDAMAEDRRVQNLNEGSAAEGAGDWEASATTTLTAAITFGEGYTGTASFNAGTGAFGAVSITTPGLGTITVSPDKIAGLVDAADKGGDVSYSNTLGGWAVAATLDVDADTADVNAAGDARNGVDAVVSDSAWSVSVAGDLAEGTGMSAAFDEAGGYKLGLTTAAAGLDIAAGVSAAAGTDQVMTASVKTTSMGADLGLAYSTKDSANLWTASMGYDLGDIQTSFAYQMNGDYDLSVSTAAAGWAITVATDEENAWSASASTAIGSGKLAVSTNSKQAASVTASFSF